MPPWIEPEDGFVATRPSDGKERRIDPSGYLRYRLELSETVPMVLRAGDQVRWTRNDTARGLINGERAEVLSIGRVNVRMRTGAGRELALARDDPQLHHLDHAYSSTVHAAPGDDLPTGPSRCSTRTGAPSPTRRPSTSELTRARDAVVVLTDDREALIEALECARGEELSALKAIGEQFAAPMERATHRALRAKGAVLDDAERERREAEERLRR